MGKVTWDPPGSEHGSGPPWRDQRRVRAWTPPDGPEESEDPDPPWRDQRRVRVWTPPHPIPPPEGPEENECLDPPPQGTRGEWGPRPGRMGKRAVCLRKKAVLFEISVFLLQENYLLSKYDRKWRSIQSRTNLINNVALIKYWSITCGVINSCQVLRGPNGRKSRTQLMLYFVLAPFQNIKKTFSLEI